MMRIRILIGMLSISMLLLFGGCATAPQVEIEAALIAIQNTQTLGADIYVPAAYQSLIDSMKKVNESIETEKEKWFPSYTKTNDLLAVVNQMIPEVVAKTEARKIELTAETQSLIVEVKTLIVANNELIAKAPRGKEGRQAVEAIKADNATVEAMITETETFLTSGNLISANDKIKAAKLLVTNVNTELSKAIAKSKK